MEDTTEWDGVNDVNRLWTFVCGTLPFVCNDE